MIETLRTLFRASRAENEDALIETNAVTLLAQHLRDAKVDVERARRSLAALIARKAGEGRQGDALDDEIVRREDDARAAMAKGEDALLDEIADRIAGLEDRRAQAVQARGELQVRIDALRATLGDAERRMAALIDELRLVRGRALQRRARGALDTTAPGNSLRKAEEIAERLRRSGAHADDAVAALSDLRPDALTGTRPDALTGTCPDADLDTRLREAGIDTRAAARRAAILSRIESA